jgi:hypothetical protein
VNSDWLDLLREMDRAGVRFLLVGAHAIAAHGIPRATRDIDFWIDPETENAKRVWSALLRFGAPLEALGITEGDVRKPGMVLQFGVVPNRIDLMTSLSGIDGFAEAWERRVMTELGDVAVPVLSLEDLRATKRASGRKRDLLDLEMLDELDSRSG